MIMILAICHMAAWGAVSASPDNRKIYQFEMEDINHEKISLQKYKGKVILMVNVASKCGLTPQYKGLQEIYMKYKDQGFVVLGFPANNFMNQEPGSNADIKAFCEKKYGVQFPMFSKISVKGDSIHPLYKYLTSHSKNPKFKGEIRWNFDKFLIGKDSTIIDRFHPKIKPKDPQITSAIEAALSKK